MSDVYVFPCLSGSVADIRAEVLTELDAIPECTGIVRPFVLGGFGALGHPSTFHMHSVRVLRKIAYHCFYQHVFAPTYDRQQYQLEVLIDRLMVRPSYRKPTAEKWHRDESRGALPTDIIYGGWINLDDTDQFFSCQRHSATANSGGGFVAYAAPPEKSLIRIPPGHVLFFNETTLHEVMAKYRSELSVRLFVGFRVSLQSSGPTCLHDRLMTLPTKELENFAEGCIPLQQKIQRGAIIPLKSGQLPAMYPKLTWSNKSIFRELTEASRSDRTSAFTNPSLTDSLQPAQRIVKRVRTPGAQLPPVERSIAPMFCTSLMATGCPVPVYSDTDMALLYPHVHGIV